MAAWFSQASLNPGVRRREVFGWAMYDFANSGYTTVVLTAVFNAYFVGVVAGGAELGHLRVDRGARRVERDRDADDAHARRIRRPARRQEAAADVDHRWLRAHDRGPRRWSAAATSGSRWC